jgi:dTDP-4-amino-4,6-dideoxygalactose transaminase
VLSAGEGGVVLTNRRDIADRVRYLRSPGALQVRLGRRIDDGIGRSMRMSDLDAALARSRLARIASVVASRRDQAQRWLDAFGSAGVTVTHPDPTGHAFSTLAVTLDPALELHRVLERVNALGVGAATGYRPLHLRQAGIDPCPVASFLGDTVLCLPTHGGVTGVDAVTDQQRIEVARALGGHIDP